MKDGGIGCLKGFPSCTVNRQEVGTSALLEWLEVTWQSLGLAAVRALTVIILTILGVRLGDSLIGKLFDDASKTNGGRMEDARAKTLRSLLKSALRYLAFAIACITILELIGIDTKALLGGAAIVGVAVGFGAQSLVKDVLTGFFIIYERQYDVGDYITAAGLSGVVLDIGLRTTRLRDWSGDIHVIPNGLVDKTTNKSKSESRALVEVSIAFEEDIEKAMSAMQAACEEIASEMPVITQGPRVLGVARMDASGVVLSVWARTKPLEQWGIERALRLRMKEALEEAGISLSYPRVVVYQNPWELTDEAEGTGIKPANDKPIEPDA